MWLGIGVGVRERGIGRYLVPFLDFLNYVLLGKVDHTGLHRMREQ